MSDTKVRFYTLAQIGFTVKEISMLKNLRTPALIKPIQNPLANLFKSLLIERSILFSGLYSGNPSNLDLNCNKIITMYQSFYVVHNQFSRTTIPVFRS